MQIHRIRTFIIIMSLFMSFAPPRSRSPNGAKASAREERAEKKIGNSPLKIDLQTFKRAKKILSPTLRFIITVFKLFLALAFSAW